jgi:hypothetical protein
MSSPITDKDIENQIHNIFNENKINDLKKFLHKRACLNNTNQVLIYLFHIIQSAGVLTTTIAAGYNMKELVWIGVGMNILASLINIFEKTNESISKRLLKDISAIKNGTYVDEGSMVNIEDKAAEKKEKDKNQGSSEDSESGDSPEKNTPTKEQIDLRKILKTPLISEGQSKTF